MRAARHVRGTVPLALLAALAFAAAACTARDAAAPLPIASTKQLFLDDAVVDRLEGCWLQLHRPVRHPANPLIRADRAWELQGSGVYLFGGTVLFDEEGGLFKMWYRTDVVVRPPGGGTETPPGGYSACLATSRDGVWWERPELGLYEHGGSRRNNILPPGTGGKDHIRRPNLIKDYEEADPERRYKMVYMDEIGGTFGLAKGYSRDGIHWRMNVGAPVFFQPPLRPNGELFGWDPPSRSFVLLHPSGAPIPAAVDGRRVRNDTALVRSSSSDFDRWGDTVAVIRRDDRIDPPRWSPGHVGVMTAILYTDDLYIGFLDTCTTHYVEDVPAALWEDVYSNQHDEHRTELVVSRDGRAWKRVAPHWWFMTPGLWGTWDRDHVALAKPIVRDDHILIYYTGNNLPCKAQIPDHPQHALVGTIVDGQRMGYAIGLATMRLDGFASLEAVGSEGTVTTRLLAFAGDRLTVNFQAPRGTLRVELLDGAGNVLPGFAAADCDPLSGDAVRQTITWKGKADLAPLSRRPARLRFHLKDAARSMPFSLSPSGPSPRRRTRSVPGAAGSRRGGRQHWWHDWV